MKICLAFLCLGVLLSHAEGMYFVFKPDLRRCKVQVSNLDYLTFFCFILLHDFTALIAIPFRDAK